MRVKTGRRQRGDLSLRAANIQTFIELARGVDDNTWCFHLRRRDYSKWFANSIKDEGLAEQIAEIECVDSSPNDSRERVARAILEPYTLPE
jgi:hypothetical protein